MKNFFNYIFYVSLLVMGLSFTSCQDEFESLPDEDGQTESISSTSTTAKLIENTTANDGSFDNIVDAASCFSINFPYTVKVNGVSLTINDIEDLESIEELLDAVDNNEELLDIIFPITITLSDYSELTIDGIDGFEEMVEECVEGGEDDDIECIDFVYPITLYTFDLNNEATGNVTVESDMEFRLFFAGLDENDLISIDFPVTLELYDDTTVVVESNAELANAIENAKDLCDEDDDDDYNDDDFTQDELVDYLAGCPWLVKQVKRNDQDQTELYLDYVLNFEEDGSVSATDGEGNVYGGAWSTRETDFALLLDLEFESLEVFNMEWFIYEQGEGLVNLHVSDGNTIMLSKACDLVDDDPTTLREALKECSWIIKEIYNDGVDVKRLLGYEFNFMAEGVVTLSNGDVVSDGTWEVSTNAQGRLVMEITMGEEQSVSFVWPLSSLDDERLEFEITGTDYELVLERNCDDDENDGDVTWIRDLFSDTQWELALFSQNEDPLTDAYSDFTYEFNTDGTITVMDQDLLAISTGNWYVYRNSEGYLEMIIRFGSESNFYPLGNDYLIVEVVENRIELKHENEYDGYEHLVFEKK
ncbi:hypothetical protein [Maribacter polysaccharolyticus]|uniref:hypothetical protein n=1 Tax=Maribacter polysaccharolyticus TaxID=3020831 RepID=UPI00237FD05F|nr:hypothetical protein [Maribacter polysaccharolyticus]MDE3741619.1 hypothetical protein [Maribacter polysaccharolyticus]